jgi:hypothetical protein
VSWGTIYYAMTVFMAPIEAELGWSREMVVGAFSLFLAVSGLAAYPIGELIDRRGGRLVMTAGSVMGGVLFIAMAMVETPLAFYAVHGALGLAAAMTLYDPAFAVITQSHGADYRRAITILTFAGGLASSVFWPITQALVDGDGWRFAAVVLGLANLAICAPLHALVLPGPRAIAARARAAAADETPPSMRAVLRLPVFWLLAAAFTAHLFVSTAMSVHIITLLSERGVASETAVALAALIGVMQVAGRVVEFAFGARYRARDVGVVIMAMTPLAMVVLLVAGASWGWLLVYVTLYGASHGVFTIVRGAIPAEIFGRSRYGAVSGALSVPSVAIRAISPWAVALAWGALGGYDGVVIAMALISAAAAALFWLAVRR